MPTDPPVAARLRTCSTAATGLPDDWVDLVEAHVAVWRLLDDDEREAVAANADWLLRHKHWEAAFGFELDDAITVTIAVQAGLLVLGLDVDELREVSAVVVYPSAMQSRGERAGPIAGHRRPTVRCRSSARRTSGAARSSSRGTRRARPRRDPGHGHNVVLHEFAHKLDMVDQVADGAPALAPPGRPGPVAGRRARRCSARCGRVIDRPPLDPYGATNPAEFFAVATEVFFDVPTQLEAARARPVRRAPRLLRPGPGRTTATRPLSYEWVISQGLVPDRHHRVGRRDRTARIAGRAGVRCDVERGRRQHRWLRGTPAGARRSSESSRLSALASR